MDTYVSIHGAIYIPDDIFDTYVSILWSNVPITDNFVHDAGISP